MSALELFERFKNVMSVGKVDWRELRNNILKEHHQTTTVGDRVLCLRMHSILMNAMERQVITPENLPEFRKVRGQEYNTMLIAEAIVGRTDGNVDPVKMAEITSREVAEGRMSPDWELHKLAVAGAQVLGPIPEHKSFWAKFRSWFKRRK